MKHRKATRRLNQRRKAFDDIGATRHPVNGCAIHRPGSSKKKAPRGLGKR